MSGPTRTLYFLGAKDIGARCLRWLVDHGGDHGVEVRAVLTSARAADVPDIARAAGIPVFASLDELLAAPDADYLLSVQYHEILKGVHIRKARRLAMNLHMAPVPEYRGCNQFSFAITDGAEEFGTTLHVMDEGIDSGDIIAERRFAVEPDATVKTLLDRTVAESITLYEEALPLVFADRHTRTPQSAFEGKRRKGFHLRSEIGSLRQVDLDWPAEKILRHIRATSMPGFPPPFARIGNAHIDLVLRDPAGGTHE